jgi:Catalytic LigB subunit of aromatic ring-opening dioxygenase
MANIVGFICTTHGPQLHTTPEQWLLRVKSDRAQRHPFRGGVYTFDELIKLRAEENLAARSTMQAMTAASAACHVATERLADAYEAMKADVAVIFGNDQHEIYGNDLSPPYMVFYGETIRHHPASEEGRRMLPPGIAEGESGHAPDMLREYAAFPQLARHIIDRLVEAEFDITVSPELPSHNPKTTGISHAFGHIYRQIMRDHVIPNVPIYQNTFFPPNQPSARRSYNFGKVVGEAIRSWHSDARVVVFGSGGMSHFVIDEEWDHRFMRAMREKDSEFLTGIPLKELQSGTSELKSWISVAGVMAPMQTEIHEVAYVPCYRSEAGTGTAQGMYWWNVK